MSASPPPGPCPREDYPLYILCMHTAPYTYTNTHTYSSMISAGEERDQAAGGEESEERGALKAGGRELKGLSHVCDMTEVELCLLHE